MGGFAASSRALRAAGLVLVNAAIVGKRCREISEKLSGEDLRTFGNLVSIEKAEIGTFNASGTH